MRKIGWVAEIDDKLKNKVSVAKSAVEYNPDYVEKKKNRKDADGHVIIEPRNFLTNPPKVGEVGKQTSFGGNLPHMADPFDTKRQILTKERLEHESKVQEKAFS
jgi:hypothetical protein